MRLRFDLSKEYGLVLEGGGAKGAYQIGAWKALKEEGVQVRGLSGVSVGALNGALICMDNLEEAQEIWENISYSQVMDVNDEQIESIIRGDLKNLNFNDMVQDTIRVFKDRGMDITPLKNLISRCCDEEKIRQSPMDFYIVTYSLSDRKLIDVNARDIPEGLIPDMLLASAYLPTFKRETLHGKHYLDGGVQDRVPLDSLISRGYQDIIVLRIYGFGIEKRVKIPKEVHVTEIAPLQPLGGTLEFDSTRSRHNLQLGYYDAKRMLYELAGSTYYLDMELTEAEAYARLQDMALRYLEQEEQEEENSQPNGSLEEEKERKKEREKEREKDSLAETLTERIRSLRAERLTALRRINEEILPEAGKKLLKNRNWSYAQLYAAILDHTAQALQIPCFAIYTEEEILRLITEGLDQKTALGEKLPDFAHFFK